MSLAKKMFIPEGSTVPSISLPGDVNLDDITTHQADFAGARKAIEAGSTPLIFVFVKDAAELGERASDLKQFWDDKLTFWLFYPKKPHLNTDLGRDKTFEIMKKFGMSGTRQVGIDERWSCLYFKAK